MTVEQSGLHAGGTPGAEPPQGPRSTPHAGRDGGMENLERQFKHLQYTEAVRVYGVATEQEKPLLNRLLREKRQNLIRRRATIPTATHYCQSH